MMFIIGVYLLFLGIILDDLTSYILLSQGFGVLETNPIYQHYGFTMMLIASWLSYIIIIYSWRFFIKLYRKFYAQKAWGHKLYDIFIFLGCLLIVTITIAKIEIGFQNLDTMAKYVMDDDAKKAIDIQIQQTEVLKQEQPKLYQAQAEQAYSDDIIDGISYGRMIMNCLFAFILFRVGYKVCPWDMA